MSTQLLDVHMRPHDVGNILAAVLAASSRPLTRILGDLSGTTLAIRVLADGERALTDREAFRLGAEGIARCRWRHGLLVTPDGTVAASTTLAWIPARIEFGACTELDKAAEPAGVILGRLGMRREDRRAIATTGMMIEEVTGQPMAVMSSAVLSVQGARVAVAEEFITLKFAESLAG